MAQNGKAFMMMASDFKIKGTVPSWLYVSGEVRKLFRKEMC